MMKRKIEVGDQVKTIGYRIGRHRWMTVTGITPGDELTGFIDTRYGRINLIRPVSSVTRLLPMGW